MNRIAYVPIDIPKLLIDPAIIGTLVDRHNVGHHDGLWKALPILGRVDSQIDFTSASKFESAWEKRYNEHGEVLINDLIKHNLADLIDHIYKLPMTPTHAQILSQITDVGKHYDLKNQNGKVGTYYDDTGGINSKNEPAGYKILLNHYNIKSFYVSKNFGESNYYISLPPDTNTFAINECDYPHGATMPDSPKFIVSIFGLINTQQHLKLINQSLVKYHDYAIIFE